MVNSHAAAHAPVRVLNKRQQSGFSLVELTLALAVVGSGLVVSLMVQQYNAMRQQAQSVGQVLVELNGGVGAYLSEHYAALQALPDRCSQVNFVHRSGNTSVPSAAIAQFADCALNLQRHNKGSATAVLVANGLQPSALELRGLGYWTDSVHEGLPWPVNPVMVGTTDGTSRSKVIPAQYGVQINAVCVDETCTRKALSSLLFNTQPFDSQRLFNQHMKDIFVAMAHAAAGDDALIAVGTDAQHGQLLDKQGRMVDRNPLRGSDTSQGVAPVLAMRNGFGSYAKAQLARRDAASAAVATGPWQFNEKNLSNLKDVRIDGALSSAALSSTSASFASAKVQGSELTVQDASGLTVISLSPGGVASATSGRISGEVSAPSARITGDLAAQKLHVTGTLTATKAQFTDKLYIQVIKTRNASCNPLVETLARDSSPNFSTGEGMLICSPSKKWVVWQGPTGATGPQGPSGS